MGTGLGFFKAYMNKRSEASKKNVEVVSENNTSNTNDVVFDAGSVQPEPRTEPTELKPTLVQPDKVIVDESPERPTKRPERRPKSNKNDGAKTNEPGPSGTPDDSLGSSEPVDPVDPIDPVDPDPTEPMDPEDPGVDPGTEPQPVPTQEEEARRIEVLAAQISLVVQRHQGQLQRCYKSAAKVSTPEQPLEGRVRLQFAIHPDGKARGISVLSDEIGSANLSNCLIGMMGSWTFPSSGSEALDFVWPFDFQAPE
jgi:hypothetical protein